MLLIGNDRSDAVFVVAGAFDSSSVVFDDSELVE